MDEKIKEEIYSFVKQEPRSIQEISFAIGKSWVTTNKYLGELVPEGTICVKVFRKGSHGALKLIYWNNAEGINKNNAQEYLYKEILRGRNKRDFSPFEIYQFAKPNCRSAFAEVLETSKAISELFETLEKVEGRILVFSGNLSWTGLAHNGKRIDELFLELGKRGVKIKIISRVEIPGINNCLFFDNLNKIIGIDFIEIRHNYNPLRGFIIDKKMVRLMEEAEPKNFKEGELDKKLSIFYSITDVDWVEWLSNVFFNNFNQSIPLKLRLESLKTIQNIML